MEIAHPRDMGEAAEIIGKAIRSEHSLHLGGLASKQRPRKSADIYLSASRMNKIVKYEPEELFLTAEAGTPVEEIQALLNTHRHYLAFDPPHWGSLFGSGKAGTLGGLVAGNISGPGRLSKGGIRDYVLAVTAINGEGKIFKGGAKVVKNVTGYDIPKLLTGSGGRLAFLGEVTLKTLPAPAGKLTLSFPVMDRLQERLRKIRQSNQEIAACAYRSEEKRMVVRLEGGALEIRAHKLQEQLDLNAKVLDLKEAQSLWAQIANLEPFISTQYLWKIVLPPDSGADCLERLRAKFPHAQLLLDWAGGLIWLGCQDCEDPEIAPKMAQEAQGYAFLFRSPEGGYSALHSSSFGFSRLKQAFDPGNVFG